MEPEIGTKFQRRASSCLSLEIFLNLLGDFWQHLILHTDCTWSQSTQVGRIEWPSQATHLYFRPCYAYVVRA